MFLPTHIKHFCGIVLGRMHTKIRLGDSLVPSDNKSYALVYSITIFARVDQPYEFHPHLSRLANLHWGNYMIAIKATLALGTIVNIAHKFTGKRCHMYIKAEHKRTVCIFQGVYCIYHTKQSTMYLISNWPINPCSPLSLASAISLWVWLAIPHRMTSGPVANQYYQDNSWYGPYMSQIIPNNHG